MNSYDIDLCGVRYFGLCEHPKEVPGCILKPMRLSSVLTHILKDNNH
jgi:hypothetical protein